MQPQTASLIDRALTIGGTLLAALVGSALARSSQRNQWLRDKRHQDYQDVLSAISSAYMAMIRLDGQRGTPLYTTEAAAEVEAIKVDSFRVIRDRIFIAEELEFAGVLLEWDAAVTNYEPARARDTRDFADRFTQLSERLVRMALRPSMVPGRFARWRMHRHASIYRILHRRKVIGRPSA